jgi:DNA-binding transcriptional regulator YhcF (GntR family)
MAQSAIKGILSGQRKVQPETLKKVFKKLSEGKVIKSSQGSGLVTSYIKKEKEQQIRMHDYKMSLRKQDLVEERAKEAQKEVQTNNKESSTTAPQLSTSVILTPVKGDKKQELPTSDIALNNKVLKNKKLKQETSPQPQESPKLEDMVID